MARNTLTSRRPPWLSFRSGSRRKATSPPAARRAAIWSSSSGQVLGTQLVPPGRLGLLEERFGHPRLAPDHACIEQAQGDPGVLGRGGQHLLGAPDRVVELDALVPHRVPDAVGDGFDVPVTGVDQDHVQVAVGAQRSPPVAAHGQEGQVALGVLGRLVRQLREPGVGLGGVAAAEFLAPEPRLLEEPAPPLTE